MTATPLADMLISGTRDDDPFGPDALAAAAMPLDRFLALLALIDRTVLPRVVSVESATAAFSLDIVGQRLRLLPRHQNSYVTDKALSAEAPKAYRLLNKRVSAARKATDKIAPARQAALKCAARTLWSFAGTGPAALTFTAAAQSEIDGLGFSALELYAAARDQAAPPGAGPVATFYRHMQPRAQDCWHAARSGWVYGWPETRDSQRAIRALSDIARTARAYSAWLDNSPASQGPSLSFLSGSGHKVIRCVAADDEAIAHVSISPTAWGGTLQAWDMIRTNRPPAQTERPDGPS